MEDLNYEELDLGIRETVRFLRDNGFNTTDSGDGVSKPKGDCVIDESHVFIVCDIEELIYEADRLYDLLIDKGIEGSTFTIQASYNPHDGTGVIMFLGVV